MHVYSTDQISSERVPDIYALDLLPTGWLREDGTSRPVGPMTLLITEWTEPGWLPRFGGLSVLAATKGDVCLTPAGSHGLWGSIYQDLGPVVTPFHIALAQEMQDARENISAGTGHTPCNGAAQAPGGIWTLPPGLQHLDGRESRLPLPTASLRGYSAWLHHYLLARRPAKTFSRLTFLLQPMAKVNICIS